MTEIEKCPLCGNESLERYLDTKDYFFTGESFSLTKCSACNFVFTNPRPDDDQLGRYYRTEKYLSHHSDSLNPIAILYNFIRNINIKRKYNLVRSYVEKGSILDIGCGTGELLAEFKKNGWYALGVEPDIEARNTALNKNGVKVESLSFLEKTTSQFDVISMWHVLEHVPELHRRMEIIKKLMNKNGIIVIALPNIDSHDAKYYLKYWAGLDVPRHLYHFSKDTVNTLAKQHGLKMVDDFPMKFDAYYISWLSEKYKESSLALLKGFIKGLLFNRKASIDGQYSGKIYVFKK